MAGVEPCQPLTQQQQEQGIVGGTHLGLGVRPQQVTHGAWQEERGQSGPGPPSTAPLIPTSLGGVQDHAAPSGGWEGAGN